MLRLNNYEVLSTRFPNNELKINDEHIQWILDEINNDYVCLSFSYHNDIDLMELLLVGNYLKEFDIHVSLRIKYMPYSRMDRRGDDMNSFSLKYVCNLIKSVGFDDIEIFEPHSDVCVALLDAGTHQFAPIAKNYLYACKLMNDNDYVMFPDGTAHKRYANNFRNKQLLGYKHRDFKTGKITDYKVINPNQELDGLGADVSLNYSAKVYIVDDLIAKGTTVYNAALGINKLFGQGLEPEINVIAAHVEDSIFDGVLLKDNSPVKNIYTTNSILTKQHEKLKIVFSC